MPGWRLDHLMNSGVFFIDLVSIVSIKIWYKGEKMGEKIIQVF